MSMVERPILRQRSPKIDDSPDPYHYFYKKILLNGKCIFWVTEKKLDILSVSVFENRLLVNHMRVRYSI